MKYVKNNDNNFGSQPPTSPLFVIDPTLSNFLDLYASIKVRTETFSCSAPCYITELWKMKAAWHALEWQFKASRLIVHKVPYWNHPRFIPSPSKMI